VKRLMVAMLTESSHVGGSLEVNARINIAHDNRVAPRMCPVVLLPGSRHRTCIDAQVMRDHAAA